MGNGYVLKAKGKLIARSEFLVERNSIRSWEPPHKNELLLDDDVNEVIEQVKQITDENTVRILFE